MFLCGHFWTARKRVARSFCTLYLNFLLLLLWLLLQGIRWYWIACYLFHGHFVVMRRMIKPDPAYSENTWLSLLGFQCELWGLHGGYDNDQMYPLVTMSAYVEYYKLFDVRSFAPIFRLTNNHVPRKPFFVARFLYLSLFLFRSVRQVTTFWTNCIVNCHYIFLCSVNRHSLFPYTEFLLYYRLFPLFVILVHNFNLGLFSLLSSSQRRAY